MKKLSKLELIPAGVRRPVPAGVLYDNVFYRVGEFHKATPSRVIIGPCITDLAKYISTTLPRFK